jgi:hypothetical protein
MRRYVVECALVWALGAAVVLAWYGFPHAGAVCGADAPSFAVQVATAFGGSVTGAAPVASGRAGATGGLAGALGSVAGIAASWRWAMALGWATGPVSLWAATRAAGASRSGAALAAVVGGLSPVAVKSLSVGAPGIACVPLVVAALVLLPRPGAAARAVGFAAVVACGWVDARTGAILGLAAAVAGGRGWALLAALVAAGSGVVATASAGVLDPYDVAAPLWTARAGAVAPGLVALLGAAALVEDRGLRRATWLGFALALGPVLQAVGVPITIGGAAVPLPGVIVAAFTPAGDGWQGALLVAAVAAALGLGRGARPAGAVAAGAVGSGALVPRALTPRALTPRALAPLALVPLAVLEAWAVSGGPPSCLTLDEPVAVRFLGERTGKVLDLPVAIAGPEGPLGAPPAAHALYLFQQHLHGRPLAVEGATLVESDPLFAEPGVVLAVDVALDTERYLLPPSRPGDTLRGLGITEIVVHRTLFSPRALALLDPVFFKLYGAPQRDHAGHVDLYRIAAAGAVRPPTPETLRVKGAAVPAGWVVLADYLDALSPPPPAEAAGGPRGPRADAPSPSGAPGPAAPNPSGRPGPTAAGPEEP